jgi:hypothetical protein
MLCVYLYSRIANVTAFNNHLYWAWVELHYHLYALAPLVLLAEFEEANNLDLYAHANGALHRLVNASIAGLQDPSLLRRPKHPAGTKSGGRHRMSKIRH